MIPPSLVSPHLPDVSYQPSSSVPVTSMLAENGSLASARLPDDLSGTETALKNQSVPSYRHSRQLKFILAYKEILQAKNKQNMIAELKEVLPVIAKTIKMYDGGNEPCTFQTEKGSSYHIAENKVNRYKNRRDMYGMGSLEKIFETDKSIFYQTKEVADYLVKLHNNDQLTPLGVEKQTDGNYAFRVRVQWRDGDRVFYTEEKKAMSKTPKKGLYPVDMYLTRSGKMADDFIHFGHQITRLDKKLDINAPVIKFGRAKPAGQVEKLDDLSEE
jgi:hypothetical protein